MYNFCILPFANSILLGYCPPSNPISLQLICRVPYVQPLAICQPRNEPLFASKGSANASEASVRMGKAFEENEEPIAAMLSAASYMESLSGSTLEFPWAIQDLIMALIKSPEYESANVLQDLFSLRRDTDDIYGLLLSFARGVETVVSYQQSKTRSTAERLRSVVQPPCPRLMEIGHWLPVTESQMFEIQDYFCPNSFYRIPDIVESHVDFMQPALDEVSKRAKELLDVLQRCCATIHKIEIHSDKYRKDLKREHDKIIGHRSSLSEILIRFHWVRDETQHIKSRIDSLNRMENGYHEAIKPLRITRDNVKSMSSYNTELMELGNKMLQMVTEPAANNRTDISRRSYSRKEMAIQLSDDLIRVSETMVKAANRLQQMEDRLTGKYRLPTIGDKENVW